MPADEQGDPFKLAESLFQDWFRDSLDGKPPPTGYRLWGYKLVRSDRCAGGELRWPTQDETLIETELSDGCRGGFTSPGTLAITREVADVAVTSAVGGSVILTVAYNPEDVIDAQDTGLVLVRRAYVADADPAALNLDNGIFRDERYRALRAVDVRGLRDRERASFLGPEPLEHPGLDARPRTRARPGGGDWLAVAVGVYRQPPSDPYDLAVALAQVARDEAARQRWTTLTVHAAILQYALPWQRQVAVQRRIDGYLLEQFGRVDPRSDDPERPMGRAEQWLHRFPFGTVFLNLAETLIEYDVGYDDLAADPAAFVQRLLPAQRESAPQAVPSTLTPGPVYQIFPGLGDDDGVPRYPELDAIYVPAAGQPQRARLEADGPCTPRERERLLGGPVTHVQLDTNTRMLRQAEAPGGTGIPVNPAATALLSLYPEAAPAGPVRGSVLLIGTRGDGAEADAPDDAVRHLADLGHPVARGEDSR
jgi:hypothetical protein